MHCVKLLGQRLMVRNFDRQAADVQVLITAMNGYTARGMKPSGERGTLAIT